LARQCKAALPWSTSNRLPAQVPQRDIIDAQMAFFGLLAGAETMSDLNYASTRLAA